MTLGIKRHPLVLELTPVQYYNGKNVDIVIFNPGCLTNVKTGNNIDRSSYNILPLLLFREMLWTRTPLNWREVEGCESHGWKEQHTRTRANSSIRHQK